MADKTDQPDKYKPSQWFWDTRKKGPSPAGTLAFTGLRALDVPFQYWLLQSGAAVNLLHRLGAKTATQTLLPGHSTSLGLSPYYNLIFGLAVGSSAKQIYWKLFVGDTIMAPGFSIAVGVYNTALNSFNTLLAVWLATSQQPRDQSSLRAFLATAPPSLYIGLVLYTLGLGVEWYSEIQRKAFKRDPANKDMPYAGGLFGLARNINYGGYTLWRSGYGLVCGGWLWAGVVASWLAGDFCSRAIPSMDAYCEKKYGERWEAVRQRVSYKLLPWVY